jgi:hypothetical protein
MLGRCDHHPDIAITTTSNFGSLPSEKNSTFLNLFSDALPSSRAQPFYRCRPNKFFQQKQRITGVTARENRQNFTV